LLNSARERFGDETTGYSEFGAKVVAQPGGVGWTAFDRRIHAACLPLAHFRDLVDYGRIRWGDAVAAVAAIIGAPPDRVAATLAEAEAAATGRAAAPFGRTSHWEKPLEPPYAVVKVTGALFHTQGGLVVDGHARVLRRGVPIPGLYAAG